MSRDPPDRPSVVEGDEPAPASAYPNPFRRRLQLIEDVDLSARLIREAIPLREMGGLVPRVRWWHYGATVPVGSLMLTAGIAGPLHARVDSQEQLTVVLGYGGELRVRQSARSWPCRQGSCLLLPGDSYGCEQEEASAVAFQIQPERLLSTARVMGGWANTPPHWGELLEQTHGWQIALGGAEPSLLQVLHQVLEIVDRVADHSQTLLDRLQLEDQIHRLLAAILLPELREESPLDRLRYRGKRGANAFDELIDYIKANLDRPLNLTELESRIHYSRRALQYAFRERLGCTASQWIRQQRLDRAQQRLQHPLPEDTVSSIAAECGYRSMSLFSVDFQQRFHVKPSQLLREARCSLPPEAG